MEDQQPAAGDLSDGAAAQAPDEAVDAQRRRHRMPRGKPRRSATAAEESDHEAAAAAAESDDADATPAADAAPATAVAAPAAAAESDDADQTDATAHADESAGLKVRRSTPIAACRGTDTHVHETGDTVDPETDQASDLSEPDVAAQSIVFVERTPPGRRAPIAIGVAAAVFVAAAAFTGAMLYPYLTQRAAVDTKLDIARTAANAITTLWSYTPDNMEQLADRSARFLGGDFQAQYRKYVDGIAPANKQAQVTNTTEVVGAAVESLNGPEATAIVYTNSTSTSPLSKNIPSMRYLSYRLTLHRQGPDWLVTGMSAITNLDLTPQL